MPCDGDFVPPLSSRVDLDEYARKLAAATRFEAWSGGPLVGLLAAYCNDQERRIAYVTSVSVERRLRREGIASGLIDSCVERVRCIGIERIELEADRDDMGAVSLYKRSGFTITSRRGRRTTMRLSTGSDAPPKETSR